MIEQNKLEEIKKLIKSGFDLELISFELDIPIEVIEKCKIQLDNQSINKRNNNNKNASSKMEQMREKYNSLFFQNNKEEVKLPKGLTQQEVKIINSVISTIEETINEMKESSKKERITGVKTILSEMKRIKNYQLTIEQAEKLNTLMQLSEGLTKLNISEIDYSMNKQRKMIVKKLAESVDFKQYQTEDLEELKLLAEKLTTKMQKANPLVVDSVKRKIETKIAKIQQRKSNGKN